MKRVISAFLVFIIIFLTQATVGASDNSLSQTADDKNTSVTEEKIVCDIFIYGDVDFDGDVTVRDATAIQKGLAGITYLTGVQRYLADPNAEGVTINNATSIQKHIADIKQDTVWGERIVVDYSDNAFSSEIPEDTSNYDKNSIIIKLKTGYGHDYTLADFPEYKFTSIEKFAGVYDKTKDAEYVLYLEKSGYDSVVAAIQAIEYRTYLDLEFVGVNLLTYPS